ncbi:MAG: rhombosortase [Gammaproteobacteria bacterium]|nr:rhombosortase [Gammaproteobacteria bacterium]
MGLFKLNRDAKTGVFHSRWLLPLLVLVVAVVLLFAGETGREALRFERAAMADGDYWRLLTGHFVHLGWSHFALNALGLGMVWYLVGEAYGAVDWLLIVLASIVVIDSGLWLINPQLQWYVGLSGVLHGILAGGLIGSWRRPGAETIFLAGLLLAKLAWEQIGGPLPGSEQSSGGSVIVDAHLYGAIGGALMALLIQIRVRRAAPI